MIAAESNENCSMEADGDSAACVSMRRWMRSFDNKEVLELEACKSTRQARTGAKQQHLLRLCTIPKRVPRQVTSAARPLLLTSSYWYEAYRHLKAQQGG